MNTRHLNFSYRFAARDPRHDVYPGKFLKACLADTGRWQPWSFAPLSDLVAWHRKEFARTTTHTQSWKDPFANFPELTFRAGPDSLTVADAGGTVVARQPYVDGALGEADPPFFGSRAVAAAIPRAGPSARVH